MLPYISQPCNYSDFDTCCVRLSIDHRCAARIAHFEQSLVYKCHLNHSAVLGSRVYMSRSKDCVQLRRDNATFKGLSGKRKEVVQAITRLKSTRIRDRATIQSTNAKIRYHRYCIAFFVRDTITHITCENLMLQ